MTRKYANFSTPHCHQASLDTGATIDEFVRRELELETGTMTVTDHGYLGACRDVYRIAKENKLTPIIGMEAYHRDDDCQILKSAGIEKIKDYYKYGHITLHALNQPAYEVLIKVTSDADLTAEQHGSERKPIFTWRDLEKLGGHDITMTSGCLIGIVSRHIMKGRPDLAAEYYKKVRTLAKDGNFYVEMFTHRCDKNWVSGVFITLEDNSKLKYYTGKKVKTTVFDEITVSDLEKEFKRGSDVGNIVAVKNRSVWENLEVRKIVAVTHVQDFMPNEPQDWCPDGDVQLGANKIIWELAKKYGDKIIISDDSHYAYPEDHIIQNARLGGMGDNFRFGQGYHRQTSDEASEYFTKYMDMSARDFEEMVDNNNEWANRFKGFTLENKVSLPTSFFPSDTIAHLKTLIDKHGRMNWKDPVQLARLKSEVNLLNKNGTTDWLPYFFSGELVTSYYEENQELTGPGRGSAAGMFTAYLLGITHADPLQYGLSQDRFMTIDRIKANNPPDIDQDLPSRTLLEGENGFLKKTFGNCFAQVSTNHLLRVRSSIEDVARSTWGHVPDEITKLTKSIPMTPQGIEDLDFLNGYEREDGKEERGLLTIHKGLQDYIRKYPDQWAIVQKMIGITRTKSRHASAFLIADKPIDSFIPVMTIGGVRCTQYTAKSCEESGALKMDYLCLNTLVDLSEAIKLIQSRSNQKIEGDVRINGKRVPRIRQVPHNGNLYDIWDLPEDQNVFREICEGRTETVFQLNTPSAMGWLKAFNHWKDEKSGRKSIDSVEAISAFTALDRPGPLDASVISEDGTDTRNMLQEFAARARGQKPYGAIPFLDDRLPETYGVIVFQEQLQKIYQDLTGCDGIKANKFRKDIAKKEMEKVLGYYPDFMEKATAKIGGELAKQVWEQLVTFGQYGFNKSHSVCYAIIAYACAYLKYYFPLEWWCAVLRNADKSEIGTKFWKYCKDFVQLPNINDSKDKFYIKDDKIIAPLEMLLGVGEGAHKELVAGAPFSSLQDFTDKIAQTKKAKSKVNPETNKTRAGTSSLHSGVVSNLILSGALDTFFPKGQDLLSKLEEYQRSLAKSLLKKRPEKVDAKYIGLSSLALYQHKKVVLPVYSEFLVPYLIDMGIDGVTRKTIKYPSGDVVTYNYSPQDPNTIGNVMRSMGVDSLWNSSLPFVDGAVLNELNGSGVVKEGASVRVAVAAYVLEDRRWKYKDKKTENMVEGVELTLDIDGSIFNFLKWPNRKNKSNYLPKSNLEGAIIVAILSKFKENSPFTIDAVVEVIPAIPKKGKE